MNNDAYKLKYMKYKAKYINMSGGTRSRTTELINAGFNKSDYPFNYILEKFNEEEIKLAILLKKKGYADIHIYDAINGAGMFSERSNRLTYPLSRCGIPIDLLRTYVSNPVSAEEFSSEIYRYMDSDEHYIHCGGTRSRTTELINAGFNKSDYPFNYILEKFNEEEIKLAILLKKKGYADIHIYDAINGAGMFSERSNRLTYPLSRCGIPIDLLRTYVSNPVSAEEFSSEIYIYMDSDEHYIHCGGKLLGTREEDEKKINCIRIGIGKFSQYVGLGGYVIGALKDSKGKKIQQATGYGFADVPTILKIISIKREKGKTDYILVCEDSFGDKFEYNSKSLESILLNKFTDWGTFYKEMYDKASKMKRV